jgi:HSP20 family protein
MPTIIRRSLPTVIETRREIFVATSWHVHSNVWMPPTDVYETEENLVIKVEVAGMLEDDFEIGVEDQFVTIKGARPDLNERRAYHQMEIRSGKFEIAVGLPALVEIERATAEYKDGFLMIIFPKVRMKQNEAG